MLQLRDYQQRSLETLAAYLRQASEQGARVPFVLTTERPYREVPHIQGLDGLPYVCLRVPTGGGKTLMACHAVGAAAKEYLQVDRTLCLWLAPSNAIVRQTLAALKDRKHPYRQALDASFAGDVRVMDLTEALYVTKGDLDGATCVVVTTLQSLRVEDTEGRKVYESAGALQHHFDGLHPVMREALEKEGNNGHIVYSLANVMRLRRPVVIMDEAHNARTHLSFDTLARFRPSCIVEFTATPETTHKPDKGLFASNVLHHVSARELKEAEMVKLPIKLRTRDDWREIVSDALQTQRSLEKLALEEQKETGEYIRPIVLFQAQSVKGDDINVEALKQALIDDFKVPEDQIAVATGSTREIQDVDLFDPECPIRYIVTVRALVEGWDCSFAYVLCSVSEISTARSVEQVLGRILRLPQAQKKQRDELNCAYAFAASDNFLRTAQTLRDALVDGSGFQRMEADELVKPNEQRSEQQSGAGTLFAGGSERVTEEPDLSKVEGKLRDELQQQVTFDGASGTLSFKGVMSEQEMQALRQCFGNPADQEAVERIFHLTQGRYVAPERDTKVEAFSVPLMSIRVGSQLELFDESYFLDVAWNLAECDAMLSESEFPSDQPVGMAGDIDVTDAGQVEMTNFVRELHEQLTMVAVEPGWTLPTLVNWLDHKVPHPDIPRSQSSLFIHNVVDGLMTSRGLELEQLARHKFRLTKAIEAKIAKHRHEQRHKAYQSLLYGTDAAFIEVGPHVCLTYDEERYAPNWYYDGGYRFKRHLFPMIGELKSEGEEFECAVHLDQMDEVKLWVRNLERRPESSFWLQTATDRFYPDFVALLKDGRILVVEYKGEDRWSNDDSKEKRAIGELWAERSGGRCLFVMPKGPTWSAIDDAVR